MQANGVIMKVGGGLLASGIGALVGTVWMLHADVAVAQKEREVLKERQVEQIQITKKHAERINELTIAIEKALEREAHRAEVDKLERRKLSGN